MPDISRTQAAAAGYPIGYHWTHIPGLPPTPLIASENVLQEGTRNVVVTTCWQLDFTFTPCGRYRIGSARSPWNTRAPFTSHLYPPGTRIWEDSTGLQKPMHFAFVIFRGEEPYLRRLVQNRHGYARILDPDGRLGSVLSALAGFADSLKDAGFWQGQGRLCEALELLRHLTTVSEGLYRLPSRHAPPQESELLEAIEACVRRRLDNPPGAPEMAKELHMGVSTLLHRFRRETGEPLMKYVMRLRIRMARELLLQGRPGKTVADQLGFCDESHFSKAFRRVEGMTPSVYVKSILEGRLPTAPDPS